MPRRNKLAQRCLEMKAASSSGIFTSPARKTVSNKRYSATLNVKESTKKNIHADMQDYKIIHHQALINTLRTIHKAGGCEAELQILHHVDCAAYKLNINCSTCQLLYELSNHSNERMR